MQTCEKCGSARTTSKRDTGLRYRKEIGNPQPIPYQIDPTLTVTCTDCGHSFVVKPPASTAADPPQSN